MREFILKSNTTAVNNSVFVSSPVWNRAIDSKEKNTLSSDMYYGMARGSS